MFIDEWDVDAPVEAVFNALADVRTYPEWWKPVYLEVEAEGPPTVGRVSRQHFKGRLPYRLRTTSEIVRLGAWDLDAHSQRQGRPHPLRLAGQG